MAKLSETLAVRRGFSPVTARRIGKAGLLHDVGKIKIPKAILHKPGKLSKQEFEVMKTHTTIGAELMSSVQGEIGVVIRNVCLLHHEWHDPSLGGYWGKSTSNLPGYISIVSIADVFVALVSERAYKAA